MKAPRRKSVLGRETLRRYFLIMFRNYRGGLQGVRVEESTRLPLLTVTRSEVKGSLCSNSVGMYAVTLYCTHKKSVAQKSQLVSQMSRWW